MDFEVEPKEFEKGRILKIVYPNGGPKRIYPAKHIPLVIDYIKNTFKNGSRQHITESRYRTALIKHA
jgi:hypothetical protein